MYLALAGVFLTSLVVCNLVANKFITLDLGFRTFTISAGALPYPITFLVTDLLSELFGRKRANRVVGVGLLCSLFTLGVLAAANHFPAIAGSPVGDETFSSVFQNAWKVIAASMAAYLTAQVLDIRMFHFWKRITKGRHLWLRNNASTIASQLVDSTLVVCVLFWGILPGSEMKALIFDLWMFKALVAFVDTPLFYLGTSTLRSWMGEPVEMDHG